MDCLLWSRRRAVVPVGCCRLSDRSRLLASLDNDSDPGSEANGTTDDGG